MAVPHVFHGGLTNRTLVTPARQVRQVGPVNDRKRPGPPAGDVFGEAARSGTVRRLRPAFGSLTAILLWTARFAFLVVLAIASSRLNMVLLSPSARTHSRRQADCGVFRVFAGCASGVLPEQTSGARQRA